MKLLLKTLITLLCFSILIPSISFSQTEHKPKYSPRKENHKNRKDELDRKQGLWKHYNRDRILMWEVEYLDDKKNGISRRYYGNGRIMKETEYSYGIKDGIFNRYGYDGLTMEGQYLNGRKSNKWTNYFSNGQMKSTGLYVNGHKHGEWYYYNRKGAQTGIIVFKGGRDVRDILAAEKKAAELKAAASKPKKTFK